MKCEHCTAFAWDCNENGSESYCEIRYLSEPCQTDDGCTLHWKTIKRAVRDSREAWLECIEAAGRMVLIKEDERGYKNGK